MQESDTSAGSAKPVKGSASRPAPYRGQSDPVIRWLIIAIFAVIILWLGGVMSALVFGMISPNHAPRTEAEAQLASLGAVVQSGKATTQQYAQYVAALISAEEYDKAQQSLNQGFKSTKADTSYLYAQQADLLLAEKDYKGAASTADTAMATAQKEFAAQKADLKKNNMNATAAALPDSFTDAALTKANALLATKDYAGAVQAFDLYIAQSPTDSDVLTQRADAKIQTGDKNGAAADFRDALKYVPDYQPAIDGLKQIGASR
jgi:predicted Zn-dependent protease